MQPVVQLTAILPKRGKLTSNDAIKSVEDAKEATEMRVRNLWELTDVRDSDYSTSKTSRDTMFDLNESWDKCKQWRNEITEVLCHWQYASLALILLENSTQYGITNKERFEWVRPLLGSLVNFSGSSKEFRQELLEVGTVNKLIEHIRDHNDKKKQAINSPNSFDLLRYIFSLLLNLSKSSLARQAFLVRDDTCEVLRQYLHGDVNDQVKGAAALCLATVAGDDEGTVKIMNENDIPATLKMMYDEGKANPRRRFWNSISCLEIATGLRVLIACDLLKDELISLGLLEVVVDLLQKNRDPEEQRHGLDMLWAMCFGENRIGNCRKILDNKTCIECVKILMDDHETREDVRELARRCLDFINNWEKRYNARKNSRKSKDNTESDDMHIMISYSWNNKKKAKYIYQTLRSAGFKVWMDEREMGTYLLQDMAEAVEKAKIVIVAYSESYWQSPNCRTEAEYAHFLQKKIVPVRMQQNFNPLGWLGAIVRPKLYIDASDDKNWMNTLKENLIDQIHKLQDSPEEQRPTPEQQRDQCNIL